jgi:hypothetical protein
MPLAYGSGIYGAGFYGGSIVEGETVSDLLLVRDRSGAPVSGITWTVLYSKTSDDVSVPVDITPSGNPGTYVVVRDLNEPISYHLILRGDVGTDTYVFYGTTHAVNAASPFAAHTGEPFAEVLFLGDAAKNGVTGRAFTTDASFDPDLNPFTPSVSAISGVAGGYIVTFTPDEPGSWIAELSANTTPPQAFMLEARAYDRNPGTTGDNLSGGGQVTWTPITTYSGTVQWTVLALE